MFYVRSGYEVPAFRNVQILKNQELIAKNQSPKNHLLLSLLQRAYHQLIRHPGLRAACLVTLIFAIYLGWPLDADRLQEATVRSKQILDRNGVLLREIRPTGRGIPVAFNDVSPHTISALIATEDRRFHQHIGVNPLAILRAAFDNTQSGKVISGASTLTMQVARILRGNRQRTLPQKIAEAMLALRLEVHLSKEEILMLWLNQVYFGNQTYGIEAASRLYFGKSADDLTLAEAAFLIGLPQSPNAYNPYQYPDRAVARQQRVLKAMVEAGSLPAEEALHLADLALNLKDRNATFKAPHFVEYISRLPHVQAATDRTIHTTLDAALQADIEALAQSHLKRLNSEFVTNTAAIVLDNYTGDVLAYLGSLDYWNDRISGRNDGVQMLRQPGSALKPFTYALALASGRYTAASILPDIETQIPEAGGAFAPQNYDKTYHGPVPLREALACSYNIPAIRVAREFGAEPLLRAYQSFGFTSLNRSAQHYGVGLTLGNGEVKPIELARAYAMLARKGKPITLNWIDRTTSMDDKEAATIAGPEGPPVLSEEIAYLITDILQDPVARQAAFGRHGPLELPFPSAVKTGTTKDYRDNWAAGFTPRHTVVVWVGNFDGQPMQRVSGVTGAGPLFKAIMLRLKGSGHFEQPQLLESYEICPLSGNKPSSTCPSRRKELFLPGTTPSDTCAVHQHATIDQRTNLLADANTPATERKDVIFTVFPEIFHPWMREHNIPFPPTFSVATLPEPDAAPVYSEDLHILYPVTGMQFQMDPVLRRPFQQIKLQGSAHSDLLHPTWIVNNHPISSSLSDAMWSLEPGEHIIELQARTPEGIPVKSLPVEVSVVGASAKIN